MSEMNDFNKGVIEEFRANQGKVGGQFDGAPVVLLTTTGAKSGTQRINPLVALPEGETLYVFASKGGAPTNPDWFHNLVAHPNVVVEYGDDRFDATANVLTGAERDRLFAAQVARMPGFGDYEKSAGDRVIPVVELRRKD
ncbi:MAG TPA: nitroreductase family deazaflavin-dependent oxidoreductase [Acidimicrobiales bacterium]|jgi:deazaflavin-dependent oxidoreductase (nitroreductase family)